MSFANKVRAIHNIGATEDVDHDLSLDPSTLASQFLELTAPPEIGTIGWPRASSLNSACMRMHVIGYNLNTTRKQWASFQLRMIFGMGNAIHEYAQNTDWLFGDNRRGWWKCVACGGILYFGAPPKQACPKCGAGVGAIQYFEHPLRMRKPVMVTGHTDMFLQRGAKVRVAEMKTMSGPEFSKLKAPLVDHEWQVQTYMWIASMDKAIPVQIDPEVGYIFYISKGWQAKELPMKAFIVKKSPTVKARIIEKLRQFSDNVRLWPDAAPPPDNRCVSSDWGSYFSKQCPVRGECIQYEEEHE